MREIQQCMGHIMTYEPAAVGRSKLSLVAGTPGA